MPEIATVSTSRQAGSHGVSQFAVGLGASPCQPSPPHRTMPAAATRLLFGPSRNTWKARSNLLLPCKVSKHIALLTRAAQRRVAVRSGKGNSNRPGRPLTTGMVRRGNCNIARWVLLADQNADGQDPCIRPLTTSIGTSESWTNPSR